MRLPQRFQYREPADADWTNGVCLPFTCDDGDYWEIRVDDVLGQFEQDPWDAMSMVVGCTADFRWIDNDNSWHPVEATCCGKWFARAIELRDHLKANH